MRSTFVLFGAFWGTWAVAALDVQRFLGFSDAQFGLLLAATVLGGVLANAGGGVLAERHGTRSVLTAALAAWAVLLVLTTLSSNRVLFSAGFLAAVAAGGLVDVVMNVAGTAALGAEPSRILRLHALFNGGALLGAAVSGVVLNAGGSFRIVWLGVAALAGALAMWCSLSELPAGGKGEHYTVREGLGALRRSGMSVVAIVFALGALVEGGLGTWGVLFLRSSLGLAAAAGAFAYVAGQAVATSARATLGWTAEHLGERRGAQAGLAIAGAGLAVEALSGTAALAAFGLAVAAVGAAVYWPLLLAYAGGGSERPGLVVGGLSAAGYLGFLAGAPMVGWIANATDLRGGLLALGAVGLIAAAVPIPDPPTRPGRPGSRPRSGRGTRKGRSRRARRRESTRSSPH